MAKAKFEWKIRHFLKDGTELKPGMQIPMTERNMAIIQRAYDLCVEANRRRKEVVAK